MNKQDTNWGEAHASMLIQTIRTTVVTQSRAAAISSFPDAGSPALRAGRAGAGAQPLAALCPSASHWRAASAPSACPEPPPAAAPSPGVCYVTSKHKGRMHVGVSANTRGTACLTQLYLSPVKHTFHLMSLRTLTTTEFSSWKS